MEVPSSHAGKLVELRVSEGGTRVSEGDVIGVVEVADGGESGGEGGEGRGKDGKGEEGKGEEGKGKR